MNGTIYFGATTSNTDPLYISRINSNGLNVSELAVFIGDDAVSSLSIFPPTTEAFPTDYFTIRSSNVTNPFHAFSSTGNYYCAKNIYCNGNIYLGIDQTSNTDPMYITRSNVGLNITEIAVYIGDDGTNSISYPSNETNNVDYFSIKSTNAGLHHIFSSTGNYYAANNINGIIVPKNSGFVS